MKMSSLALAAVLAASWSAVPSYSRADQHDDDDRGGDDGDRGDRERGDREERGGRGDRGEHGDRGERGGRHGGMRGEGPGGGPFGGDPAMKEKLTKVRDLERSVRDLAKKLTQGSESEKAAAKAEARKALGELFDAKLALETSMLEKMEKHAAELKAKIAKKKGSRDKLVESRLARMTGEGDDEW